MTKDSLTPFSHSLATLSALFNPPLLEWLLRREHGHAAAPIQENVMRTLGAASSQSVRDAVTRVRQLRLVQLAQGERRLGRLRVNAADKCR